MFIIILNTHYKKFIATEYKIILCLNVIAINKSFDKMKVNFQKWGAKYLLNDYERIP